MSKPQKKEKKKYMLRCKTVEMLSRSESDIAGTTDGETCPLKVSENIQPRIRIT